ncbi:MAG: UDP-3-O-(3-hydroxymyristoyl)glucosamine N-acyltransferase [Deltaproteobacteria bacterium]|nr:UDP-3-O-(3-hydroxymyristoyl)glucosamine N-acyltransferase [Deltaproteobacteria bacterium]
MIKSTSNRTPGIVLEYKLKDIAELVGGEVVGDGNVIITGINSLDQCEPGEISFYFDARYRESLERTRASAVITSSRTDLYGGHQVIVSNPALAYAKVAGLFSTELPRYPGISKEAHVEKTCRMGDEVSVYPFVYIGKEAEIGDRVTLFPGVFVGDRVRIGARTVIYPNVTIMQDCVIGNDVIIHAGCVIGSDGFGFVRDDAKSVKIPQIGIVQIDDEVEIGANSTIDRAALGKTWVKRGVKTDNLVQVAHNVIVGEDTVIVAQTALGGSVRVGKEAVIGGQVAISDHVTIGDRAMIGSQSGVPKSIPKGSVVSGTPAMPHRLWLRASSLVARLPELNERLRKVEKLIKQIQKKVEK